MSELKEGYARLEVGQVHLEEGQARLEEGQARLTADVSELKEGYARLEVGQVHLEEGQARLEERQDRMEERQYRMEQNLSELRSGQLRMSGELSNLSGVPSTSGTSQKSVNAWCGAIWASKTSASYTATWPSDKEWRTASRKRRKTQAGSRWTKAMLWSCPTQSSSPMMRLDSQCKSCWKYR